MSPTSTATDTELHISDGQQLNSDAIDLQRVGKPAEHFDLQTRSRPTTAEDESHYPTGMKLWLVILSIFLVLIVAGLDNNITAIAVPAMTDHWHTVADIGWYSAAYRLCICSFQFMFGKLYKMFSVKRIYLMSITVLLLGSVLCAAAPSSLAFIVGRAICGFAGAGNIAGCYTLIVQVLPLRKRPMFAGVAAAVEGISVICAPIVGGLLVENLSWRWCFWINLPLGGVTWMVVALGLQDVRPREQTTWRQKLREVDLIGNLVFIPSLTCLFMVLSWAGVKYPWNSPTIIGLLAVFVVLLVVFAVDQWLKQDVATIPPKILKNRNVLAGFVFSLSCNGALNVVEYYLPTYLQAVREYSPGSAGYLMLPFVIGMLSSLLLQGALVNVIGYYVPLMLVGSVLMPIFAGLLTTANVHTSIIQLLAYSALLGFAGGIGFQGPQIAVQNTLAPSDTGTGLAVILFAQNFGPAVFVAAAQTIFTNRLSENLHQLAPHLNVTSIESMGLGELKSHVGAGGLEAVLLGFDRSLIQTWYLAVALTCMTMLGSLAMEWKNIKQKRR